MGRHVSIGNVELYVVEQGAGPPLLLVHGFPLDHSMWRAQIDALSDKYHVIAPDLRGFGRSTGLADTQTLSMQQMADDLALLLSAIKISEPVTFCGLSMGGYIAWQFWQHHRAQLGRLILCDTRAVADTEEVARARQMMATQVLHEGNALVADSMLPKLFADTTASKQPEIIESTRQVVLSTPATTIAAVQRGMAQRPDVTDLLPSIDLPTLVVCGERDTISPVEEMREIAAAIPGARFNVIEKAGHMSPLENPKAFNAAVREFLQ